MAKRRKLLGESGDLFSSMKDEKQVNEEHAGSKVKVSFDNWPIPMGDGTNSIAIRGKGTFEVPREVAEIFYDVVTENWALFSRLRAIGYVLASPTGKEHVDVKVAKRASKKRRRLLR